MAKANHDEPEFVVIESPVHRLRAVLLPGVLNASFPGESAGTVIAQLMRLPDRSHRLQWSKGHIQLVGLLTEAVEYAEYVVPHYFGSPYDNTMQSLVGVLVDLDISVPWKGIADQIRSPVVNDLQYALHAIDVARPDKPNVSVSDIIRLDEMVRELRSMIIDSELSPDTKSELITALNTLDEKVTHIVIYGESEVRRAAMTTLGALPVLREELKRSPEVGTKWVELVTAVFKLGTDLVSRAHVIKPYVQLFLGTGTKE